MHDWAWFNLVNGCEIITVASYFLLLSCIQGLRTWAGRKWVSGLVFVAMVHWWDLTFLKATSMAGRTLTCWTILLCLRWNRSSPDNNVEHSTGPGRLRMGPQPTDLLLWGIVWLNSLAIASLLFISQLSGLHIHQIWHHAISFFGGILKEKCSKPHLPQFRGWGNG